MKPIAFLLFIVAFVVAFVACGTCMGQTIPPSFTIEGDSPRDVVLIAANTNDMTQGQITSLNVFLGEHFPEDMLNGENKQRQEGNFVDYNDGARDFRVISISVKSLEKPRRRITYEADGETIKTDITHGKKVTAIRIANIREPFNSTQFKIERIPAGTQGRKLTDWTLVAGLKG